jgi:hypothetical protein
MIKTAGVLTLLGLALILGCSSDKEEAASIETTQDTSRTVTHQIRPVEEVGEAETQAAREARAWLEMVDQGKYEESWERASTYFKSIVTLEQWLEGMEETRQPMGKTLSRKVVDTQYRTSIPGAPEGEYVIVKFSASFENSKLATETVTPMLEENGEWRVSGYYIK